MYASGLLETLPNTLHSPVQAPVAVAQYRGSKFCAKTLLLRGVSIMFDLRELPGAGDLLCLDRYPMAATPRKYFWPLTCSWLSCPDIPTLKLQKNLHHFVVGLYPEGKTVW